MSYLINREIEKFASGSFRKFVTRIEGIKPQWNAKRIGVLREYANTRKLMRRKPIRGWLDSVVVMNKLDNINGL
ncbi:MAG: hypothetical protein WCY30_00140 [Candidatus Neomarinimicrobiota bacterium]|jgi:hypothetical protein